MGIYSIDGKAVKDQQALIEYGIALKNQEYEKAQFLKLAVDGATSLGKAYELMGRKYSGLVLEPCIYYWLSFNKNLLTTLLDAKDSDFKKIVEHAYQELDVYFAQISKENPSKKEHYVEISKLLKAEQEAFLAKFKKTPGLYFDHIDKNKIHSKHRSSAKSEISSVDPSSKKDRPKPS